MTATYEKIATTTASGSASSVTFSSISSAYTDLILICNVGYTSLGANTGFVIAQVGNGSVDTGSNYSQTNLLGNGTTASSNRATASSFINFNTSVTGTARVSINVSLQNYSNTTTYKTNLHRISNLSDVYANVSLWRSTSAINTLKVYDFSGYNFDSTSTFTIYGIKAE